MYGLQQIINENMTVGVFLVNLQIIRSIGQSWGLIYQIVVKIQMVCPSLARITHFMNLPVDTWEHMRHERDKRLARVTTCGKRQRLLKCDVNDGDGTSDCYAVDLLKIKCKN